MGGAFKRKKRERAYPAEADVPVGVVAEELLGALLDDGLVGKGVNHSISFF
jgi:hypothetical protein